MEDDVTTDYFPETPFSIYLLKNGEVFPKRIFTVTRKNVETKMLYVAEMKEEINYEETLISIVVVFWPN